MGVWTGWQGVLRVNENRQQIGFWCQGCKEMHVYDERWQFNGNHEKPTFTPSLLTKSGHYCAGAQLRPDGKCQYCEDSKEDGEPSLCSICHLFVTDGQIIYLADCTHPMAGKTVAMTVKPEREEDG